MDGIRISRRPIQSQAEEVSVQQPVQQQSTGIAQTPDGFESNAQKPKGDLFETPSARAPAGTSGMSAFSNVGAMGLLRAQLGFLQAQRQQLESKINMVAAKLIGLEIGWQTQMDKIGKNGGKGGGIMDLPEFMNGQVKEMKALQAELEALKSQLANVDVAIKETIKKMQKLESP